MSSLDEPKNEGTSESGGKRGILINRTRGRGTRQGQKKQRASPVVNRDSRFIKTGGGTGYGPFIGGKRHPRGPREKPTSTGKRPWGFKKKKKPTSTWNTPGGKIEPYRGNRRLCRPPNLGRERGAWTLAAPEKGGIATRTAGTSSDTWGRTGGRKDSEKIPS